MQVLEIKLAKRQRFCVLSGIPNIFSRKLGKPLKLPGVIFITCDDSIDGVYLLWFASILISLFIDLAKECVAVTLFLGSNDASLKSANPIHHVPLDEYRSSLVDVGQYILVRVLLTYSSKSFICKYNVLVGRVYDYTNHYTLRRRIQCILNSIT